MDNAQSAESILKQNTESEAFNRGYDAANRACYETLRTPPGIKSDQLRERCTALIGGGKFREGWLAFCDKLEEAEKVFAAGNTSFRKQKIKDKLAAVLTWILFAAAVALVGLYAWAYYLRQADRAAEEHRLAELAGRIQWLGNMTTYRYWAQIDHDPRSGLLVMENRQVEIGLKPDGTVVWRKLPAGKQGK